MKCLILDMSNLLYRTFHASNTSDEVSISLAHHKGLMSMNKWFRKINPDMTVAVFDRPNNWRKLYTLHTPDRPSPLIYKGQRRQNMTPKQALVHQQFMESVKELESLLREQTKVIALAAEGLEADDLIAGFCQRFPDCDTTIVSGDGDFIQLLRNPNVKLLEPKSEKYRDLSEYDNNADFFIFQKCCSGDTTDNVMRIFPKVYKAKVRSYFTDELKRTNAFNETWKFQDREIHPGNTFAENKLLMDLACQPEGIRELIDSTINEELGREKSYKMMRFLRFCGAHDLRNIANDSESFTRLFTTHP